MSRMVRNERGMALVMVLLIAIAVTALAMAGIVMTSAGTLTSKFHYKELALQASADGGAELARDSLNRNTSLLPDSGYVTLQSNGAVLDASGAVIPGFTRSVYAGRTGGRTGGAATSGQYGSNYASALSVIQDTRGAVAVRRFLLTEESWSRFAYAMNKWSNSGITFACGEIAAGPVHSNASVYISCGGSPKTLFMGPVTTVGTISGKSGANFQAGYSEGVQPVKWPAASDLAKLQTYAQDADAVNGDYDINGTVMPVGSFTPTTRIEFLTIDLNANGIIDPNEGFFRVFRADSNGSPNARIPAYVTAKRWPYDQAGTVQNPETDPDPNMVSPNCGAVAQINGAGATQFWTAFDMYRRTTPAGSKVGAVRTLLTSGTRRCFLGGDPRLFTAFTGDTLTPDSTLTYADSTALHPFSVAMRGKWLKRSGAYPVPPQLALIRPGDQQYLIPLQSNVNFKGVIYVRGPVAVSGRLRGRVTVAASGAISLADDLLYTTTPGSDCSETGDVLGITTPEAVPIADNNVQNPFQVNGAFWGLYDDTPDIEQYQMFIFTLKQFYGEDVYGNPLTYNAGSIAGERCAGNTTAKSGCVQISGGIIQDDVGAPTFSNSSGWAEQHTYDKCGISSPPPYFPTTGRYLQNRVYEIDPVWLNRIGIAQYFRSLQSQ